MPTTGAPLDAIHRHLPVFTTLREFLDWSEKKGDLVRVARKVAVNQEITAVQMKVLAGGGPVLRFDAPVLADGSVARAPVVTNLFGTKRRVAAGLGLLPEQVSDFGTFLAELRTPPPVDGMRDALSRWPMLKAALSTRPKVLRKAPVQEVVDLHPDLSTLPVQTCWPGDGGPLITWPVVLTRSHGSDPDDVGRYNAGVYRAQVKDKDRLIMRWLAHRGGAAHHRGWAQAGEKMPIAIVLGADPATLLAATLPLPETVSELAFSGVLRGERMELVRSRTVPLLVPAHAEMVIEGWVSPTETAPEGPFGDHTGYYNAVEPFPVVEVTAITQRARPLYLSTSTGRPPDEPSVIAEVVNELVLPVIRQQIPEVTEFWLPPAACSYRIAVVAIDKRYPGQARRVMMALWGMLPQFSYTKMVIVVDKEIDVRSWDDIAWAISTRMDPARDVMLLDRTPMDYLDFASPIEGLAGKIGLDATTKIGTETSREWGRVIAMSAEAESFADKLIAELGVLA
ncbi:UbiD family decarboxylase [Hoeflea olei]|uniref:3-octaprenyl-4-hydroxybenzoate carboxy-lyase n=1 Tax=Hoeflea olei TaxID=1480615 RepID=A0A1C1Z1M1_9HYPH|nr:UbiD family decarboxylase [Hoeflea olei]OCW59634.1 3-octaprenyl-4-hydroxybenzoate carboxy-lyase [Hoeflea olei]